MAGRKPGEAGGARSYWVDDQANRKAVKLPDLAMPCQALSIAPQILESG